MFTVTVNAAWANKRLKVRKTLFFSKKKKENQQKNIVMVIALDDVLKKLN